MIITEFKNEDELKNIIKDSKKVFLVGCGLCATECKTGDDKTLKIMETTLLKDKEIIGDIVIEAVCNKNMVRRDLKNKIIKDADTICAFVCGSGVAVLADLFPKVNVLPMLNTLFLGKMNRVHNFSETCAMCGDCVLDLTAGICPRTQCAKSIVNGPCGGSKNGKCEVDENQDCAWIKIYEKLKERDQLEKLDQVGVLNNVNNKKPRNFKVEKK